MAAGALSMVSRSDIAAEAARVLASHTAGVGGLRRNPRPCAPYLLAQLAMSIMKGEMRE